VPLYIARAFLPRSELIGDECGKQTPEVTSEIIRGYVKRTDYDVIVVSGVNWSGLADKSLPGLLREQVERGVGLVLVDAGNRPDQAAERPSRRVAAAQRPARRLDLEGARRGDWGHWGSNGRG